MRQLYDIYVEFFFLLQILSNVPAYDPSQCIAPLGMENRAIRDEDITASSSFDSANVGPRHARIRTELNSGAWCPLKQATFEPEEWIQIDLKTVHMITATGTQGRFGNGQGVEFAEAYMLEYWRPRLNRWVRYHNSRGDEVLEGNINTYLEVKRELDLPIWATKVRFYPYSYHKRTVCMRVELYGCIWTGGILSYSMPQGDKRGYNWEFYDFAYDGHWEGDHLRDGLGQLVDGKFGQDDFKTELYNEGQAWIGWKNDTKHKDYIEIKFEFDKMREFSSVHIYCNNQFTKEIQVFSAVKVFFSIGGKYFEHVEPIVFEYMEDCIFENARNVTIKLYHRVGRFVNVQIYFSSKWLMISEITFDSIIAHGNFSVEPETITTLSPSNNRESSVQNFKNETDTNEVVGKPTYLTFIVVALILTVVLLKVFIFLIYRIRIKKFLRTPDSSDTGYVTHPQLQNDSVYGMSEKGSNIESYGITEIDEYKRATSTIKTSKRSTGYMQHSGNPNDCNEYQEPYQAIRYASYYTYSPALMEMKESFPEHNKRIHLTTDTYDYAIPEAGSSILLGHNDSTLSLTKIRFSSIPSGNRSISGNSIECIRTQTPDVHQGLSASYASREENELIEFPRHRLRMISKLSEGAFGTIYIAEADGIMEYASSSSVGMRLVAIKFLREIISEKEKEYFDRDVRILAALEDPNIARVLGICTQEDPMCVIFEYLDYGDLCQFLKTHVSSEHSNANLFGSKTLTRSCLLLMGTQVAKGMRYLESLNFVHRDLATRNCLIGKSLQVKICDFGTYNKIYVNDYFKVDGSTPLPIRWMAWEAIYNGQYTTKSDVWSFAVLLWEILTLASEQPYSTLTDREVMENSASFIDNKPEFFYLPMPSNDEDIYELMLKCWKRNCTERPTFMEIHSFLQCKNIGYAPS
ncbi:hypothetical protein WA026_020169 [Henosepilachna vigintioctopunctata]|uniref:Uncharacterized protein n=1 Tax=Henosepilachna vigintioctopunctata TaxID=420089 RepID=A0AAW1UA45_9CUCU